MRCSLYRSSIHIVMKITQIYVIITDNMFAILTIINLLFFILQKIHNCNMLIFRHLIYSFFIRRYDFIDFWTRNDVFWRFLYFITNFILNVFFLVSLKNVVERIDYICLINMIFLFFEFHFNFLVDVFEIFLHIYHNFHEVFVVMIVILNIIHVILNSLREFLYRNFKNRSQMTNLVVKTILDKEIWCW